MLVVKIELWPGGNAKRAEEIGRTYIANMGGSGLTRGDYKVAVCHKSSDFDEIPQEIREVTVGASEEYKKSGKKALRSGEIKGYPRLSYNVWRLVLRAMAVCFQEDSWLVKPKKGRKAKT